MRDFAVASRGSRGKQRFRGTAGRSKSSVGSDSVDGLRPPFLRFIVDSHVIPTKAGLLRSNGLPLVLEDGAHSLPGVVVRLSLKSLLQ